MKRNAISATIIILLTTVLASCNSTKLVVSWQSDHIKDNALGKILVLSLAEDREMREALEFEMIRHLKHNNIKATASSTLENEPKAECMTESEFNAKIRKTNATAVMLISLIDNQKNKQYYTGTVHRTDWVHGHSKHFNRYLMEYDHIYSPVNYRVTKKYLLQTEIYTITEDELVYAAQIKVTNPRSRKNLALRNTEMVIKTLLDKKLIGKQN